MGSTHKSKDKSSSKEREKKKKPAPVIAPPVSESEEEESSEEEEVEEEEKGSSSSGSEESESEEEEEEEEAAGEVAPAKPSVPVRAAEVFQLPDGYKEIENERSNNPFSSERLKGKQIWLFTTPANVPLSEVKKFKLEHLSRRKPVADVKGKKYCLREEDAVEEAGTMVLLPSEKGKGRYLSSTLPVAKCIRLEEYVELPSLPTEDQLQDKRIRPTLTQPKGLKMRFRPIGAAGTGNLSDSETEDRDVEMADADAGAPKPLVNGETRRKEKRRISEHGDEARKKVRFDATVPENAVSSTSKEKRHKSKEKKKHRDKSSA